MNEQIISTVKICRKHEIKTVGSFIFGHPTETEDEMKQTISFARKLDLNFTYFHKMIPIPNSELFDMAVRDGTFEKDVWTDFMLGDRPHPLYSPVRVSADTINKIYRRAWFTVYLWPPNIWRNRSVFFNLKHLLRSAKAFVKLSSKKRYDK